MSNQDFQASHSSRAVGSEAAPDSYASKASEFGHQAAGQAKEVASDAMAGVMQHLRDLLDQQVERGADTVGSLAGSLRAAARDLDNNVPQLAGFAHASADSVEQFAETLRGMSAEEVWDTAARFTRRQPALVFGLAAVAGYLAFRTVKSAREQMASPPIQPGADGQGYRNA